MGSAVKRALKLLCCDNGWSYGAFWRFDGCNSMLLTLEDAYYEQQIQTMLGNTLLHVHMLGEGIIGQVASTGKHRWMFSDACRTDSFRNQNISKGDYEIHRQFSSGIKTISVILVETRGVALFGSTRKILESVEFLDRTKGVFKEIENVESHVKHNGTSDHSNIFASSISSVYDCFNGKLKFIENDVFDDLAQFQDFCAFDELTQGMSKRYTVDNLSEIFSPPMPQNKSISLLSTSRAESDGLGLEHDLFDGLGLDFESTLPLECWEDFVPPVASNISECNSGLGVSSSSRPRKGLFSELGIETLLNGIENASSVNKPRFDDQGSSTKRRRMNFSPMDSISCSNTNMALFNVKKPEEPTKGARRRARPGESARPRPKDRQMIQDRLTELRKLIPNGNKPPIDVLLDRTIKYMIFLQSVTKYADKLKQADEPKVIDHGNGVVTKDSSRGVTWAFEVGGQTPFCPVIVEDLKSPGQMLIEMLCEDQGFFLEIADIIRGIGLNILNGVMELRENKIWARFIVEATRNVTRTDIFWSLIQLLQQTGTGTGASRIECTNPPSNVLQLPGFAPISLAETLQ